MLASVRTLLRLFSSFDFCCIGLILFGLLLLSITVSLIFSLSLTVLMLYGMYSPSLENLVYFCLKIYLLFGS